MREIRTSGSVGALGEQSPRATRPEPLKSDTAKPLKSDTAKPPVQEAASQRFGPIVARRLIPRLASIESGGGEERSEDLGALTR
jgi:hypothetical protein